MSKFSCGTHGAAWLTLIGWLVPVALHGQILETETARPIGRNVLEVSGNFEYQFSSDGREAALPFALEYGFSDRLEFLIEPVAYTSIRPKVGSRATGVGDLETTLTYLLHRETGGSPAIAFAGEVKFPTAHNTLIGTGKSDFAGYLIASRMFGRLDTHANLGFTVVGKPAGSQLKNIFNFALGGELQMSPRTSLFGEVLANTASASGGEPAPGAPTGAVAEAPAGEIVGTVGIANYIMPWLRLSGGMSVDNNGAVMFRPGFTIRRP
ncbi:MAG: hypothetical protein ABI613_07070 [Gemmatimonadota bacterium]